VANGSIFFGEQESEELLTIDPLVSELSFAILKFADASYAYKKDALRSELEFVEAVEWLEKELPNVLVMPYDMARN
jgi:hypothetical protein